MMTITSAEHEPPLLLQAKDQMMDDHNQNNHNVEDGEEEDDDGLLVLLKEEDENKQEEEQEQHADGDDSHHGERISHVSRLAHSILHFHRSWFFVHFLLLLNGQLFGGFQVLAVKSLSQMNPLVFAALRTIIIALTIAPLAILVDRNNQGFCSEGAAEENNGGEQNSVIESAEQQTSIQQRKGIWQRYLKPRIPNNKRDALWLTGLGMIVGMNILTYIVALSLISPTIVAIVSPSQTVFTCLISVLLKREGKSILKFVGVFLAVIGSISMLVISAMVKDSSNVTPSKESTSAIIAAMSSSSTMTASILSTNSQMPIIFISADTWSSLKTVIGVSLCIVNSLGSSLNLVFQKSLLDRKIPPMTLTAWTSLVAMVFLFIVGLCFGLTSFDPRTVPLIAWIGLLYAGLVIGTGSFSLGAYAARIGSPTLLSVYNCANPIISTVYLFVFLGQTTTWLVSIGAILITSGVLMVAYAKKREERKKAAEDLEAELQQLEQATGDQEHVTDDTQAQEDVQVQSSTTPTETTDKATEDNNPLSSSASGEYLKVVTPQ